MYRPKKRHCPCTGADSGRKQHQLGGSMSIKAIGLPEALHKGNYKVLDRDLVCDTGGKSRDDASRHLTAIIFWQAVMQSRKMGYWLI